MSLHEASHLILGEIASLLPVDSGKLDVYTGGLDD
jgi:hypothetical protein